MEANKKLKSALTVIVILALGFAAYQYVAKNFMGGNNESESASAQPVANPTIDEASRLYDRVVGLSLDGRVFESRLFGKLEDITSVLPALSVGRANPFSPVSSRVTKKPGI